MIDRLANLVLSVVYFIIGAAAVPQRAGARLSRRFVTYDNNRIKKLVE